jgi:hypothetical protein
MTTTSPVSSPLLKPMLLPVVRAMVTGRIFTVLSLPTM